jgi:hypothetical protein
LRACPDAPTGLATMSGPHESDERAMTHQYNILLVLPGSLQFLGPPWQPGQALNAARHVHSKCRRRASLSIQIHACKSITGLAGCLSSFCGLRPVSS